MTKLKPCPFCGGEAIVVKTERCGRYIGCWDCGGRTEEFETDYAGSAHDKAIAAWNRTKVTGETSDGYHTFNELYHHRAVLFSVICNDRPNVSWKSKLHHDGTMFDGMFIVGIQTPEGQATYHYDIDPYWDMFRVPELPQAPEWDGHTSEQAIERIGNLPSMHTNLSASQRREKAAFESNDGSRALELLAADRDGRCVVLPCKVGDTVYALPYYPAYWVDIEETKITGVTQFPDKKGVSNQIVTSCCLCYEWERDIGKTIFLTREEAEAALKGAE